MINPNVNTVLWISLGSIIVYVSKKTEERPRICNFAWLHRYSTESLPLYYDSHAVLGCADDIT